MRRVTTCIAHILDCKVSFITPFKPNVFISVPPCAKLKYFFEFCGCKASRNASKVAWMSTDMSSWKIFKWELIGWRRNWADLELKAESRSCLVGPALPSLRSYLPLFLVTAVVFFWNDSGKCGKRSVRRCALMPCRPQVQ